MRACPAVLYCLLLLLLHACTAANHALTRKLPASKLQADVTLLQKILEANHPGLYWYTPKDSMDAYFKEALLNIHDSETEVQFRNQVAWLIAKIKCGHTSVLHSKKYAKAIKPARLAEFPLFLKTWNDSLVVLGTSLKDEAVLKRGTVITGINGLPNQMLLDSMRSLISTDGNAAVFKNQLISFNFPGYYRSCFGLKGMNRIDYIDSAGHAQTLTLPDFQPAADTLTKNDSSYLKPDSALTHVAGKLVKVKARSLDTDTLTGTALLRVTSFSGGGQHRFFRRSFKRMQQHQMKNLVIDLRQNGGGNIGACTALSRYIVDHSFRNADTVAAISRKLSYGRYIHPSWVYWLSMHLMSSKQQDGRYHLRFYEKHIYQPRKKYHFNGNVYVLQGGFTFSASCMFIDHIKGQRNVTLVGEETGGGSYGNSAVHLPEIVLPHSGLRITLPLYRLVFNHLQAKNGRGFMPDVPVRSTPASIKDNKDLKMDKTFELISGKEGRQQF